VTTVDRSTAGPIADGFERSIAESIAAASIVAGT
jgi:hypothetical protein